MEAVDLMYKIVLARALWKDSERKTFGKMFFRQVEIPFLPFIGLAIRGDGWDTPPITSVRWSVVDHSFFCEVEDKTPLRTPEIQTTYEDLLEHLEVEQGWIPAHKWKKLET